jgi:hypothetical protein
VVCGSNGAQHRASFIAGFISFRLRNRIENNPGAGLDGGDTVFT